MEIPWPRPITLAIPTLTASLLGLLLPGAQAYGSLCPAQLVPQLDAALNQAPLDRAYTGLVVQTLAPPQARRTLFARHGDRLFTPASNVKLLTTAAALHRLGADYRIRTSIYGSALASGLG
ncbi:MAG TPA: D-alanyl-D-alanine carboxypeptidase, partial [Leptolyngbyaceae cyanobacterium M65_K2018_010]|nr:D-alanyl-D-alanine carboxypeptidase [Leptolyngbyaceae cyanobacterium M65_K2018_010]